MKEVIKDEDLMVRVSNGNLKDLSCLFERYNTRIYNFLFRMLRDEKLSEDLTQEVFFNVLKYKSSYDGRNFSTWIYSIARNIMYKEFNSKKIVTQDFESVKYKLIDSSNNNDYNFEHLEICLNKLDFEEREIIILNKIQGVKFRELSIILNVKVGALKTKSHRTMKKLREIYLKNYGNDEL